MWIILAYDAMSDIPDIGGKMDVWAQLWPNPYPGGKVHKSVVLGILPRIGLFTRFSTIFVMVELSGISDLSDVLATSRTIRDKRNEWRESYDPDRKAISA